MRLDQATFERLNVYEAGPEGPPSPLRVVAGHEPLMRLTWGYFALGNSLGAVIDFMSAGQKLWSPESYSATKTTFWVLQIWDAVHALGPDHTWEDFAAHMAKYAPPDVWRRFYSFGRWRDPASALAFRMPDRVVASAYDAEPAKPEDMGKVPVHARPSEPRGGPGER